MLWWNLPCPQIMTLSRRSSSAWTKFIVPQLCVAYPVFLRARLATWCAMVALTPRQQKHPEMMLLLQCFLKHDVELLLAKRTAVEHRATVLRTTLETGLNELLSHTMHNTSPQDAIWIYSYITKDLLPGWFSVLGGCRASLFIICLTRRMGDSDRNKFWKISTRSREIIINLNKLFLFSNFSCEKGVRILLLECK